MYWSRRFRRHLQRHTTSRITGLDDFALPLQVPEIIVDDDRGESSAGGSRPGTADGANDMRATMDFSDGRSSFREMFGLGHDGAFSFSGHSRTSSRDSNWERGERMRDVSPSPGVSPARDRGSLRMPTSPSGRTGLSARLHRVTSSVDEGPIDTSELVPQRPEGVRSRSRPGSENGASALGDVAMETFNESVWGESLRRSFTVAKRSDGGPAPLPPFAPPSPKP